ncbi:hypothetical protein [Pedobacter gandavensis]|uniref:Yippee domain-containing protein n=1 Tax=Pedobacter gandavensis TaxID=2679963 RepID=A0ABR6EUN6_9SPHI|nr:hypothetical protein [Pedobacter gandavensis]MBB2148931.1 hypothetical protein [Pedobacter gandavensis]
MKKGECKLCGQHTELINQSHIFSSFMYKGVFDTTKRTFLQDLKKNTIPKYYQTGFYDKSILCQHCDNVVLGKNERYADSLFHSPIDKSPVQMTEYRETPDMSFVILSNINYKSFKLFVLGILWRAHISKNLFFKGVNIPDHESELRKMIITDDPGDAAIYEIALVRLDRPNDSPIDLIPTPTINQHGRPNVASFLVGGYVYCIGLEPNCGFSFFPDFSLKSSNEMLMPRLKGSAARGFLRALDIPEQYANYFTGTDVS